MQIFRFVFLLLWVCCSHTIASPFLGTLDSAPAPAPAVAAPPQAEVENLIKNLENDQTRQVFIQDLKLLLQSQQKTLEDQGDHPAVNLLLAELLENGTDIFFNLKKQFRAFIKVFKSSTVRHIFLEFSWVAALAICGGFLVEQLFLKLFQNLFVSLERRAIDNHLSKLQIFLIRTAIYILALLVFTLLAVIIVKGCEPQPRAERIALFTIGIAATFKAYHMFLKTLLAPDLPALRLVSLRESTSKILYKISITVGLFFCIAYGATTVLQIIQASREAVFFIVKISTIIIGSYTVYATKHLKPSLTAWIAEVREIEGKNNSSFNRFIIEVAKSWHPMLTAYVIMVNLIMLTSDIGRYQNRVGLLVNTTIAILTAYLLMLIVPKFIQIIFRNLEGKYPLVKPRMRTYRRLFVTFFNLTTCASAVIYCSTIWKIDAVTSLVQTGNNKILLQFFSLALILLLGIIAWELNEIFVERKFGHHQKIKKNQPLSPDAHKRLKTIQPLIRNIGRGFILLFITLMFFSELGLNIAPLLAGASVFGIALSLGGQTLVKDIITGSFILIEDTMNIGDYVEISGHSGRIENMSLRTVTLRDSYGGVHSIPFNSISTIINLSKSFSICVFNFVIDQSIDMKKVIDVLKEVTDNMRQETDWAHEIIEPLEVLGVPAFDSGGYTLRVQLKVAPGRQWRVEREINGRFSKAFEQNGIKSPINKQWMILENSPTSV